MDPQFLAQFADLGITGVFLGYLLWKDKAQTKALADFVDRLLGVLATVEKEREEGFDKVRDRYDEVIAKYDAERDKLLLDISSKLEDIISQERTR
tara:strand:- start:265 stop:549 length:285 start_codon:yes stop_codon:yes gene_type:complete